MRKNILHKTGMAAMIVSMFCSCVRHENLYSGSKERIVNCITSEAYEVPVREGYATYVLWGEDTLAVATEPITIQIPRQTDVLTKGNAGNEISLKYEILEQQPTYSRFFQAVMFEDLKFGDYDYNDLVIHVRNTNRYHFNGGDSYKTLIVDIQPIALGSTNTIKLGCVDVYDRSVHIISENVRKDLFGDKTGFINTVSSMDPVRYKFENRLSYDKGLPVDKNNGTLAWFIEVDGNRYFAVNSDLMYEDYDMLNTEGMPYGLVFFGSGNENGTFAYPEERTSIFEAYPDFRKWIDKKAGNIGKSIKNLTYRYSYDKSIPGTDGKYYKIWDYKDLE